MATSEKILPCPNCLEPIQKILFLISNDFRHHDKGYNSE